MPNPLIQKPQRPWTLPKANERSNIKRSKLMWIQMGKLHGLSAVDVAIDIFVVIIVAADIICRVSGSSFLIIYIVKVGIRIRYLNR